MVDGMRGQMQDGNDKSTTDDQTTAMIMPQDQADKIKAPLPTFLESRGQDQEGSAMALVHLADNYLSIIRPFRSYRDVRDDPVHQHTRSKSTLAQKWLDLVMCPYCSFLAPAPGPTAAAAWTEILLRT